jgi:hypothetical protein
MAIPISPLWCGGTLGKYLHDSDAMTIDIVKTGDDTQVAIGDKVIAPVKDTVVVNDPSLSGSFIAIKIEDVIAKVT